MYFDLPRAPIYKAVRLETVFSLVLIRSWKSILLFVSILILFGLGILKLYELLGITIPIFTQEDILWGTIFIILPAGLSVLFFQLFIEYYLRHPKIYDKENIAELLNFNAAHIFAKALIYSKSLGEKEVSTNSLLISLLEDTNMQKAFFRLGIDSKSTAKELRKQLGDTTKNTFFSSLSYFSYQKPDEELQRLLSNAYELLPQKSQERISELDLLAALFDHNEILKRIILDLGLDKNDLCEIANWYEKIYAFRLTQKKFWIRENLLRKAPIGRDWIYGHPWYLNHYAEDLTETYFRKPDTLRLIRRKNEMDQIEQILSRAGENNVLLAGEEGIGKHHIVEDFAELIAKGKALPALNYKKVFILNVSMIAASSNEIAEVQNTLIKTLNEAVKAGNIILVIEEIHNFIGEIKGLGRLDITEILLPYLRSSNFQVIATTDPTNFHKYIENRSELMDVFERISIQEPETQQAFRIAQESLPAIEHHSNVLVTYGALKCVISGGDKYIRTAPFPEKAFDLLSESISYVLSERRYVVMAEDVNNVISRKTGVTLGTISGEEKEKLINLEEIMRKELVGQERAIEVVAATMRRLRTGLSRKGKPAGVFLFIGPTGVGKTQTAKILAKVHFGSEEKMLRFDMSEYQDIQSLERFLGSMQINEPGQFVTAARDNPFALILLDEIEKANRNVLNIFLQVFDEGHLTDVFGRKVSFEQHVIIATSNAAADVIRELVKEGIDPSMEKEKIMDVLIEGKHFAPEFLNRFDEVVIFHPLSEEDIYEIAKLNLNALAQRLEEQNYIFKPTDDIVQFVARVGFDPQFGARPLERVIKDKIESVIAKKILEETIQKGIDFTVSLEDIRD